MSYIKQMVLSHPQKGEINEDILTEAITAIWSCAETCVACSDACLGEKEREKMLRCIRVCQDCGDICNTTARIITRHTESDQSLLRAQLVACAEACQVCGLECKNHGEEMEHCAVCATACQRCYQNCQELISIFSNYTDAVLTPSSIPALTGDLEH